MPQSLDSVLVHIIFSTRERFPYLNKAIRPSLYAYLASISRRLGCECPRIGGVDDHVHLAIQLSRTITIASLIEELKTASSRWLKIQSPELSSFAWQRGYGVFSVGHSDFDALVLYIDNQELHHKSRTFQSEFRVILEKYELDWDERFVWD